MKPEHTWKCSHEDPHAGHIDKFKGFPAQCLSSKQSRQRDEDTHVYYSCSEDNETSRKKETIAHKEAKRVDQSQFDVDMLKHMVLCPGQQIPALKTGKY